MIKNSYNYGLQKWVPWKYLTSYYEIKQKIILKKSHIYSDD